MFGYVAANYAGLEEHEKSTYRAYYCGLCHALRKQSGTNAGLTLNYDMVFLAILLTGLYESETQENQAFCLLHPTKKQKYFSNEMLSYVSDMNILLAYHNLLDGWRDDKNPVKKVMADSLKRSYTRIISKYERQKKAVEAYMEQLMLCQEGDSHNPDEAAGLTGEMMAEIFAYKEDEWADTLRKVGFYLGKFIYLVDAYEDLEADIKHRQYNVWKHYKKKEAFEDECGKILTMMASECAKAFEMLPIIEDVEILRNILYSGVWIRYDTIKRKRVLGNTKLPTQQSKTGR